MNYTATNMTTGETHQARTKRNAMAWTARMIASDVEGQMVFIDGPNTNLIATNNGLTIRYIDGLTGEEL